MTLGRRLCFLLQFLKCDLDICRWKREIQLEALPAGFSCADLWYYVFVFKSIFCYSWSIVYQVACEKQKLMVQVASHSLDRKERGRCEFNAQPIQRKVFLYLLGFGAELQAARLAVRWAMVWLANVCYQKNSYIYSFSASIQATFCTKSCWGDGVGRGSEKWEEFLEFQELWMVCHVYLDYPLRVLPSPPFKP